jgi:hypothetical protein
MEWFTGLDPKNREGFEQALRNAPIVIRQLLALLDRWESDLDTQESKISDYDTPSWAMKQAHRNGDRSRIRKLRDLLGFLTEK